MSTSTKMSASETLGRRSWTCFSRSAKAFGLSPLSLLLPEAIAGVLAVALLYFLMERRLGTAAGQKGGEAQDRQQLKDFQAAYEKAKTSQWNARTDLPWDTDVDPERVVAANREMLGANGFDVDVSGTVGSIRSSSPNADSLSPSCSLKIALERPSFCGSCFL